MENLNDWFRNTSVFSVMNRPPPDCFLEMERHFAPKLGGPWDAYDHPILTLAGNLCRRLASMEYYVEEIESLSENLSLGGHLLIETRLTGYFGSCKSLLDAGAIAVCIQHQLGVSRNGRWEPIPERKQDFANDHVWNILRDRRRPVFDRYNPLRRTMREVIDWRHLAVHRRPPRVIPSLARDPNTNVHEFIGYETEATIGGGLGEMVDPLYFHRRWHPDLLRMTEEVCRDIISTSYPRLSCQVVPPLDVRHDQ